MSDLTVSGQKVSLIDTPGFDDSEIPDTDILERISIFLQETYAKGVLLTGVILLQPVTHNRIQGNETRRLRLFKKICGPNAYSHVIIATTMWSELKNPAEGESRVQQRIEGYWNDMLERGAQVVDHEDSRDSAIRIIERLINKGTVALQMQKELEYHNGQLIKTEAGQQMLADYGDEYKKIATQLERMKEELAMVRADRGSSNRKTRSWRRN